MVEAIRMPATTAFMVKAAKELTGMEDFGVVAVTRAAQLKAHRDSHNEVNSENAVVALTTFQGGGVWIEEEGGDQWREVTGGGWIRGRVHDLLPGQPVVFNPRRWHEPQRAVRDRVVMMTYTPRTTKLTKSDWEQLRDLGFSIKLKAATEGDVSDLTPCISQQYVLTEDDVLESFPKDVAAEEETTALDGSLLRASEYQQQLLDDMLDRSSLLQDLLEEEEERMEDFRQVHQGSLESAKQVHGEVTSMVKAFAERTKYEHRAREECLLRAATVEDHQDYEQLLDSLQDDLQVTHTVPLQQVKPVADRWSKAIQKEILNLFNTGTLKKIKLTDAKKMEAQGLLRLVPSKGVFTLKPPAEKGGGFKRKYRLVLCGNFVDPADAQGSLYAGGVGAETLRSILTTTSSRSWKGATTDITSAFIFKQSGQSLCLCTRLCRHGCCRSSTTQRRERLGWYVALYTDFVSLRQSGRHIAIRGLDP